ncbi:MAG: N-acetylneuraminate synthase family protein [Acidobacteria bacterium]|nr:N-acetylneuraminate synthase family protein [Acidobacteriota bacterium]
MVIAEIGQAHDGSLGQAHALIDVAADCHADVVKFQTHIAAEESSPDEPWRIKFSKQDATRFDYWKRMEFTEPQWHGLKAHADERGLGFISSPFSLKAVELLTDVGVDFWKVASGEVTNLPMLDAMANTGKPIVLSSGMSPMAELASSVAYLQAKGCSVSVMQCTTAYPCPADQWGLLMVPKMAQQLGVPCGFSDHSGTIYAGLAAAALGAHMIEVHLTFHTKCFGPDTSSSLTPDQLAQLTEGVGMIRTSMDAPYDKDAMAHNLEDLRRIFMKSVCASRDLPKGHRIQAADLITKKPGTGIPAAQLHACIDKRLSVDVRGGQTLHFTDLEA